MSHVVISYSREDVSFADLLVTRLQAGGVAVWIDREGVGSGDWERKIEEAIQHASDFVLVVSPRSKASPRVLDELHHARRWLDDEHIHPVILEDVPWMGIERLQQHDSADGEVPATLMRILGAGSERDDGGLTGAGETPAQVGLQTGGEPPEAGAPRTVAPEPHDQSGVAEASTPESRWTERAFAETLEKGATSVAFTPDGSHLVAAGPGGHVGIWSVETGQLLKAKHAYASNASGIAVSGDGTRAAIPFPTGQVRVIRLPGLGGKKLRDPPRIGGIASVAEFSRVRPHLAIGGPGVVKVWDWEAERELGTLERHSKVVHSISFDACAGHLVTCDSECAHVWDSTMQQHIRAIRPTSPPAAMATSMDGTLTAFLTIAGGVEVYEFESGELVGRSPQSAEWVRLTALAFTPDGELLSADARGVLRLWGSRELELAGEVGVHPGKAHAVACSPGGGLVVSCARPKRFGFVGDGYPRFWVRPTNVGAGT